MPAVWELLVAFGKEREALEEMLSAALIVLIAQGVPAAWVHIQIQRATDTGFPIALLFCVERNTRAGVGGT